MWLLIAVIGYAALAAVNILDKYILEKAVSRASVFVFYSSVCVLPILLLAFFGFGHPTNLFDWSITFTAGFSFAFALWAMYLAFQRSEVSHAGPLNGAAVAVFVFILSSIFLGETFDARSLFAFGFLVVGSLLISHEKSSNHRGWHAGMTWAVFSGLLFAISHVASKYIYTQCGFVGGLIWTRGFFGIFSLLLLFSPAVRVAAKSMFSFGHNKKIESTAQNSSHGKAAAIAVNRVLSVLGVVLIQWAISLGSVTIVNALAGLQYAVIVIGMLVLSKFLPNFIKEDYGPSEIIQELAAVFVIGIGLALLI
ncbi:MAG: EamA family transporter [Patescibacteria group bacterium]